MGRHRHRTGRARALDDHEEHALSDTTDIAEQSTKKPTSWNVQRKLRGAQVRDAITICRDAEILPKMVDVARIQYNNVVRLHQDAMAKAEKAGNDGPMLEFARDKHVLKAIESASALLENVAQYGYQKLARLDYVGDAPTMNVDNRVVVELKIGAQRHAPPLMEASPVIDGTVERGAGNGGDPAAGPE